ncbi:hypothetical protein H0484_05550 [Pusillimonas sp. CC-YST705]|uniref:Lipoprotein n=1 Tax=Mesopusillimonas faecipullorum TaxID=2755040 RepID=A0ABS8CB12_9BURK|nr:hypothetical protein [Mesopusillimonas faecipullorum]MCB5363220.1 hypothetical protein [Mesopusillimonas faecipullorum]
MKSAHVFSRVLLPVTLAGLLAACQTVPPGSSASAPQTPDATTPAEPGLTQPGVDTQQPTASQPAPVAVLLADTVEQEGWRPVPVQSGTLYVNPEPIIIRDDLTGVQAGRGRSGEGLLALGLSPDARLRLQQATTQFPNKRLALIVGRTMLAAPSYTTPVDTDQLVFPVGTEQNAAAAARAIAGRDEPDEIGPAATEQPKP